MPADKSHHPKKHRRSFVTSVQDTFKKAWNAFNNHDSAAIQATLDSNAILLGINGQQVEALTAKGVAKYLVKTFPNATFTPVYDSSVNPPEPNFLPASGPITVSGHAKWVNPDTGTDETIFYNFVFSSKTGLILILWAS
jgi:hypothetical protein